MGYILQCLPHKQFFNLFFFFSFFFLSLFQITSCLHAQLRCTQEHSSALLEFRRHFSFDKSASFYQCDFYGIPSYPKLESWKEGTDCCSWDGVKCDIINETRGQVIGLDLSCSWLQLQGSLHPNSTTLFHSFPHLQRLNLAFNDFGNSPISPSFGRFTKLTHLNLSYSGFSGEVPIEVSFLTNLVSLDLSDNDGLRLQKKGFDSLVQNLTKIREFHFAGVNISSVVLSSFLNLSTSLISLHLSQCGLHGKVPNWIFHLPHLKELSISDNNALAGHIPRSLNSSSPLQLLDLSFTSFSGELPDSIGNLKSLKKLLAWNCEFNGSIPASVGNLQNLIDLGLASNKFTGMLPPSLSNLRSLIYLGLAANSFHGRIGDFLPDSNNLAYLYLGSNNFSGPFPSLPANPRELFYIDVSNNQLTGPLPSQITTGLPCLSWLYLGHNLINGTIPSWVFALPALQGLDLSHNKLTGHINEFQSISLRHIDLSHNNIYGTIPSSIFKLENLTDLILSSNHFNGTIKLDMLLHALFLSVLDLSSNSLSGVIPGNLGQDLSVLNLSNNNFSGAIPQSFANLSQNLLVLDLSRNNFGGAIPHSLVNLTQNLLVLDLQKNKFSGTIPDAFARGSSLKTINLNGNGFEGPVPKSLVNCRILEVLDLGSNKFYDKFPHWLENLPNLHVLVLRSNQFYGPMPTSKTKFPFPNLRVIDISNNYFNGPVPKKYFQNFKAMMNVDEANFKLQYIGNSYSGEYYHDSLTLVMKGSSIEMEKVLTIFIAIDLSKNKFEGEIPEIIGSLISTRGLNLSHNSLAGPIPTSFGNLTKLEWLDLSSNKLIGKIPQQLTNLIFLGVLNLSQNQLTGPIPQGKQFDTFSNDSYIGNLALCGTPLSNTCSNQRAPQPPPLMFQKEEDSESLSVFEWEVILPGYGCGLVFGLVTGYLMFSTGKPQWLVKTIEGERYKRPKKHPQRHRRGRN